jgi:hypothetical protein
VVRGGRGTGEQPTVLDDLLEIEEGKINDTRLYRCLARILPHKTKLEQHLKQRYGELFGAEFEVLLYDLTSTYVEGAAEKNAMMGRGYSRDHRPDCEQMGIALIVNPEGFAFSYETFDGNRADGVDHGEHSADGGTQVREGAAPLGDGSGNRQMKRFEVELLKDDRTQVRADVEVKQVAIPSGEERYILCRTAARKEKEKAIRKGFSTRMEAALEALEKNIASGRLKDRYQMERRLGRIQARHPQVNDLFEVALRDTPAGVRLVWEMKEERKAWRDLREGAYLLRTNLQADSAEQMWSMYMQLTEARERGESGGDSQTGWSVSGGHAASASFRALKSELSIRPLFHQKEPRVKAHVVVAFLGYALWVTLKHLLQRRPAIVPQSSASEADNAQPFLPMKTLALLSTLQSADIVLPTTDGREIRLRRITEPTAEQKSLLHQLQLSLPDRLKSLSKCSADLATA